MKKGEGLMSQHGRIVVLRPLFCGNTRKVMLAGIGEAVMIPRTAGRRWQALLLAVRAGRVPYSKAESHPPSSGAPRDGARDRRFHDK